MSRWTVAIVATALLMACRNIPRSPPASERVLLWEVERVLSRNQYPLAASLLDSLKLSKYPPTHNLRGEVLSMLYRFDEAEEAFSQALALDPVHRDAAYHLGNNFAFLGKHRPAVVHFKRFLAIVEPPINRNDSIALAAGYLQVGRAYAHMRIADSAETAYRSSIAAIPEDAKAWAALAELMDSGGEHAKALAAAKEALARDSTTVAYRLLAGLLYLRVEDAASAEPHLRAAAESLPWSPAAQYNLGRCLQMLGHSSEAALQFAATDSLQELASNIVLAEFAVRRNPHLVDDWYILSTLYQMAGHVEEAQRTGLVARALNNESRMFIDPNR